MMLSHKIELKPTVKQENYFRQACGIARFVWNWGLAEWQRQYAAGKKPNGLQLKKQFNAIKATEFPWVYEVTKYAAQQPFIYLQKAFQRFFKKESHYPRFKRKGVHDSFYIGNDHFQVVGKKIRIPRLGWVKLREALRFEGQIVSATISRIADRWFVSIQVQLAEKPAECESQAVVGVDLGIKTQATLYDGKETILVDSIKPHNQLLKRLQRAQRCLSKKQKDSRNYAKQRLKVARLHYRIRCRRQHGLHQLTTYLTTRYKVISIEDLNVKGMMSNHCLARHVADQGFHEFRRQLTYKCELRGNRLLIVDRWFPSSKRCARCHVVKTSLSLSDREFVCEACDIRCDRDVNAAMNLYTVSYTGIEACGEESAGIAPVKVLCETSLDEARTKHEQICSDFR